MMQAAGKALSVRAAAKQFLLLNLGTLLLVAGVYFFKFPNHFSTGGVTGIAVVLSRYFADLSPGMVVMGANLLLLVVGFLFLGKSFGLRTVYSSLLMSAALRLLEVWYPMEKPFTTQPLLELVFAVMLPAVGSAILFHMDASTGGTDIVAMLFRQYTNVNIGRALLMSDLLITVSACVAFGMEIGLFSILGLIIKSLMIDNVVESFNQCKYFNIICSEPDPICDYIVKELHRGATVCKGEGIYTHSEKYIIFTAMKRKQAIQLRKFIRETQPDAFLLITTTSEIIGKGFLR